MTSVNESNARQRGRQEGYDKGYETGFHSGWHSGWEASVDHARSEGLSLRWYKLLIAGLIGFMLAVAIQTHAAEWEITVSAAVPETEMNMRHAASTPETAQPTTSWWQQMVGWGRELFTTE